MPSLNSVNLLRNEGVNGAESVRINIQGARDENIAFWLYLPGAAGQTVEIRGAPDAESAALSTPNGGVLLTIINTGSAAASQVKVNAAGHAMVTVQALPIMWVRYTNGGSTSNKGWVWLVE